MTTAITFISAAATRVGQNPVTSIGPDTIIGRVAGETYEELVRAELASYRWKWATKTVVLAAIDGDTELPWTYVYQLPTDVMLLRTVKADGAVVDYELMGTKILTNASTDQEVIAHYTYRPVEAFWPPFFAEYITRKLEALFLRAIGERYQEADAREKMAEIQLRKAKLLDSQSQPATDPVVSTVLVARRG
ncbi:MAG: hypothetical protein Q7R45_08440 [Sulfuricaulis sp.]|nr:hypothetical protein [Sulfuricaulis sp.]